VKEGSTFPCESWQDFFQLPLSLLAADRAEFVLLLPPVGRTFLGHVIFPYLSVSDAFFSFLPFV